ncbi:unnamed protein product [Peniophora sp. CBMAI 1063]|nr:unnamed protein product [Peniophora sp. CBMAI 1063]
MAFFSRPASASAAVKIVAPSSISNDTPRPGPIANSTSTSGSGAGTITPKKDTTKRECRNIHIYGSCKFQDKGCTFYHPPAVEPFRPTTPPNASSSVPVLPDTPSRALAQAVNAPVFVPKTGPTSPPPVNAIRARSQTPTTLSDSPPLTEYNDSTYDPNRYLYHGDGSEPTYPEGEQVYAEGEYGADGEGHYQNMEYGEYDHGMDYYPQTTFVRQPLNYHLYALPPSSPPSSHFISKTLRTDLQLRSETLHTAPAPGLNLPEEINGYHTLVPLESTQGERRKFGGFPSTVYRATGKDGRGYVLRRVENFRLMHESAFKPIEQWSALTQPNIIKLHEAFTTRSFSDNSVVFVYTYHPTARTLYDAHLKHRPNGPNGKPALLPERTMWSYVIQVAGAVRAAHEAGLALRVVDVSKVLLTGAHRVRVSAVGVADVLGYGTPAHTAAAQQDDLAMLGRLMLTLCTGSVNAVQNMPKTIEFVGKHYSGDVKTVALFLLSGQQKHVGQVFEMLGSRLLDELDEAQNAIDHLESNLYSELENARLFRLLAKLSFINERPEFARDARWSETGDRYIVKLFRDYVFHQVDSTQGQGEGRPVLDMTHVLSCLNKLDAGTEERMLLVSRDEQSVLVVSYRDVKACVEAAFAELSRR